MAKSHGHYILGSDLGTSGCKSIIMDAQGKIIGWALKNYPTKSAYPGWAEQDPEDWYKAFCDTVQEAICNANINSADISVVCIVGITHNAVLLDRQERVLRQSIIYTDIRSISQADAILQRWGDKVFERTWNSPGPLWTWPELMWVRDNEPAIWSQVDRILFPKDFVRNRIVPSFLSDPIDPVGSLLFDPMENDWIHEFIDDLGLPQSCFPPICPVTDIVGQVTEGAALETGLKAGTFVATGTTDTAAEVFGVGALNCGQAVIKLATVGRIMAISSRPLPNPAFLNYPHVSQGYWYPGTSTKFAASSYSWAREAFWEDVAPDDIYQLMDQAAESVPAGAGGLLFHPYLAGEFAPSWDPHLRASFIGLGRDHKRGHFTRAVMEGVGFSLRHAFESVIEMGLVIDKIRLIGGGTESRLWPQIMANILNREIAVPIGVDAAYGAAVLAGIAAGIFENSPQAIHRLIQIRSRHEPQAFEVALYNELFGIYCETADAIREVSHKLHNFQTDQQNQANGRCLLSPTEAYS